MSIRFIDSKPRITKDISTITCFIAFIFVNALAREIDTVFYGNNTAGPFYLGEMFIDTTSIKVIFSNNDSVIVPPYTFINHLNALLFSQPIDSTIKIRVIFRTSYFGTTKLYSLYKKTCLDTSAINKNELDFFVPKNIFAEENLSVSGYKSVGVSVGNMGQMNLEQALEVSVFGDIAPNTRLSANLSDQGTSLEGETREISEIDMVSVSLTNPSYTTVVGDQYLYWPAPGIISSSKKIKGVMAAYTPKLGYFKGFGALSGGKHAVQTIIATSSLQGPYFMKGNGEQDIIMPRPGTVVVFVNEQKLKEGKEYDYIVDYALASLTFTPRFLIKENDVIRVEYEYKLFNYQRSLVGTEVGMHSPDSSVVVNGALWYETDNKNSPIDLELSQNEIAALANAGDRAPVALRGISIHPNDVAAEDARHPLYIIATEISPFGDTITYFKYKRFDPEQPHHRSGFFRVWFRPDKNGFYVRRDTTDTRGAIFDFVSPWSASLPPEEMRYSPSDNLPMPERKVMGELQLSVVPTDWSRVAVDIAAEDIDSNLFSSLDDENNSGAASKISLELGTNKAAQIPLWFKATHGMVSDYFTQAILSDFSLYNLWDIADNKMRHGERHYWEAIAKTGSITSIELTGSYGQFIHERRVITDKFTFASASSLADRLTIGYSGMLFRQQSRSSVLLSRRDTLLCRINMKYALFEPRLTDAWRWDATRLGRGNLGLGAGATIVPLSVKEEFNFTWDRRGYNEIIASSDTGFSVLWHQTMSRSFLSGWNLSATTNYYRRKIDNGYGHKSVLASITNDINIASANFSMHQDYSVNYERSSEIVQIPIYVGEGFGDYSYTQRDGITEFTPNRNGEYAIQTQEIFDPFSTLPTRKTALRGIWSMWPQRNSSTPLLSELSYNGSFGIEEHIPIEKKPAKISWIPGYVSLKGGAKDTLCRFADIFYRQSISWHPRQVEQLRCAVSFFPSLKRARKLHDTQLQNSIDLEKGWKKWRTRCEFKTTSAIRNTVGPMGNKLFTLSDRMLILTPSFIAAKYIEYYTETTLGWSKMNNAGYYYGIKPAMQWKPSNRGFAEISYTFFRVDIEGDLDYRMAKGFSRGSSHLLEAFADLNFAKHFTLSASYQGLQQEGKKLRHTLSCKINARL